MKKRLFMVLAVLALMVCALPMAVSAEGVDENACANGHTFGTKATVVQATCTENGYRKLVCTVCGAEGETTHVYEAKGHSYTWTPNNDATCTESGTKTGVCTCGVSVTESNPADPAKGHTPSTGATVKQATCTEDGYRRVYCAVDGCGTLVEETIYYAKGHTPGSKANVKLPTCTEDGYRKPLCTECGEETEGIVYPAKGHTPGEQAIVKLPTCTEAGYRKPLCTECGEQTEGIVYNALGHKPGADATCTTAQTCTECGEVIEAALGHAYVGVVTKDATYLEEGEMTYTCASCGDSYTEVIAKLVPPSTAGYDAVPKTGSILIEWLYALIFG